MLDHSIFSNNKKSIDLGLGRITKVLNTLKNPQDSLKVIHIAGTNGKGSTANIINQILIESGLNIGLYTSPHLFSYTERIKINNKKISDEDFISLKNKIENECKNINIELTEFEILTAICFLYFHLKQVDVAILEVGLGGRLDATNVIKNPIIEVITSISKDHTERLGETIELIAKEKAGIIKENSKIVVSPNNKGYETIKEIAEQSNSKIIQANKNIEVKFENKKNTAIINGKSFDFGLLGEFQAENLNLSLCAIENLPFQISDSSIKEGLEKVRWKFRMEYIEPNILIDGCHNPDGAKVLRNFLDSNFKNYKKRFIWGSLAHKDWQRVLDTLIKDDDELYFYHFDYPNSLKYNDLENFKSRAKEIFNPIKEIKNSSKDTLIIVCGSLYMLGNIFRDFN